MPMEDTQSCGNSEERAFQGRGVKALCVKMWRDSVGSWKNSAVRDGQHLLGEGTGYSFGFSGKWILKQDCSRRRFIEGDAVKDEEEDLRRADWALHRGGEGGGLRGSKGLRSCWPRHLGLQGMTTWAAHVLSNWLEEAQEEPGSGYPVEVGPRAAPEASVSGALQWSWSEHSLSRLPRLAQAEVLVPPVSLKVWLSLSKYVPSLKVKHKTISLSFSKGFFFFLTKLQLQKQNQSTYLLYRWQLLLK